ncbi:hypothetical protein EW145_g4421 [Phellinidium pouzarii]|uniref:UspA domain-containing protein n=1 Tax=Phellinidium pouzarii TaxID=167371 RepID=A0A4S4L8G5_9AGAM|nr:hypothetical protein EW145_g4421 [Phellinidium pouzarii]
MTTSSTLLSVDSDVVVAPSITTKMSTSTTAERPNHISLPPASGLRSAMKHHHPQTPASSSSISSSPLLSGNVSPLSFGTPLMTMSTGSSTVSGAGYLPKVSFDTFENPAASMFSYTLQAKSEGYRRNRSTRVFLCAASPDESGCEAFDWVMESLVQDGDELIVLRGFDAEELDRDHDAVRDEARELLRQVQRQNIEYEPNRKLSIIVEFIAGKVTQTIERLIALYRPDSLVVGTRGQRGVKVLGAALGGMGSVSKCAALLFFRTLSLILMNLFWSTDTVCHIRQCRS